ncbi:MAG: heterodisulfide reductase-related iron-sulfur binding cluster [Planctomycetota bacterium]
MSSTDSTPGDPMPASFLEAASLDCIHCGLCLRTCPTFQLTGSEASSPRGRIHLMRAAAEGRLERDADFAAEMDFCLLCRHCESACPAGVRFGEMMEHTRSELTSEQPRPAPERFLRWLGFAVVLPNRRALRLLGVTARLAQTSGLNALAARLLGRRGRFLRDAPSFPPLREQRLLPGHSRPEGTSAPGTSRGTLLMLEGCVMPVLFGSVNRSTAEALTALGHDVVVPRGLTCCGSLHAHNGELDRARRLAHRAIEAFESEPRATIVINSAGCGAHLRELANLFPAGDPWRARAAAVAARVRDFSEVVAPLLDRTARQALDPIRAAWDAPCHLCHGQQVREQPLAILDQLEGVERVPLDDAESCCGSAGIYSLLRPDDAAEVLEPKLEALERSGAEVLVTANPGCHLQWRQGLARRGSKARVRHLAELVAAALRPRGG